MRRRTAFITGVTGQDGAILSRFLLGRGYAVHGLLDHHDFHLHTGDLTDGGNLVRILQRVQPDEIYNLGAQSHVAVSFDLPELTADVNGLGTLRLLEAIRILNWQDRVRFYQASSSEMFGNAPGPQDETTPFAPCSPYAAAKLYAYWTVRTYREAYGMHASNGILFNHESPLRGAEFVTRKIARAAAQGLPVVLGNLEAKRDWGHARDYVEGMWMMLQQDQPGDYVLATGEAHSVREFAQAAYAHTGVTIVWRGEGLSEQGICKKSGRVMVSVDQKFFRPAEINYLLGNAAKARKILGWAPKIPFTQLVAEMVDAESVWPQGEIDVRRAAE